MVKVYTERCSKWSIPQSWGNNQHGAYVNSQNWLHTYQATNAVGFPLGYYELHMRQTTSSKWTHVDQGEWKNNRVNFCIDFDFESGNKRIYGNMNCHGGNNQKWKKMYVY